MYSAPAILEAARAILDLLEDLLGDEADDVRDEVTQLLSQTEGIENVADQLLEVLSRHDATREWMRTFLDQGRSELTKVFVSQAEEFVTIPVFYGTDRKRVSASTETVAYGFERSDDIELGICDVSIPKEHRTGHLESPSFWKLEFRYDPSRHVVLQRVRPLAADEFHDRLRHDVEGSVRREVLVFVHGFNVTFEDAARRAAQIAYDLEFGGPAVMYSWPSRGKLSPAGYRHDSVNAMFTVAHLRQFLQSIGDRSGATAIHVIAHSMGNQALTNALKEISLAPSAPAVPISEVILTAPDIDAGIFRQMADQFRKAAQRVTLYASANDRALHLSKKYQGNFVRVGDCSTELFVFPGIDSIDVSAVDSNLVGHFYYGDNKSVLSDVFYLLKNRTPADERFGLIERLRGGQRCWVFRP